MKCVALVVILSMIAVFFFLPALIRTEGLIVWDNVTAYLMVSHGLVTKKKGVRMTL